MAGLYQGLQWSTGLVARERPDRFCYWMTLCTSGLSYVIAVYCTFQITGKLGLPLVLRIALTASLALASVALPYVQHVNNHILLLGLTSPLMLILAELAIPDSAGRKPWLRLLAAGTLAGLGYTVDLGVGPVLLLCTLALILYRCRSARAVIIFSLGALPWLALHHGVNYAIGGTWKPANAVPEYVLWPGCGFTAQNMTGSWNHENVGRFLLYAAGMLMGKKGFWGHNLCLYLLLPAIALVWKRRSASWPEVLFAFALCSGTWMAYALTSNNSSGLCCSIRWFVPLLAPAYFVLALLLRDHARVRWVFFVLAFWGTVMAGLMWWKGPWMQRMVPYYWQLQAAAALSLIGGWRWRKQYHGGSAVVEISNPKRGTRAA
jgi:hypothetical protein